MAFPKERTYTIEGFESFIAQPANRGHLFELIQGEIAEKMPTEEHGEIALIVGSAIRAFVAKHKLGRVGVEIRH